MREIQIGVDYDPALNDLSWAKLGQTRSEDQFKLVFFTNTNISLERPDTVCALYEDTRRQYTIEYELEQHQAITDMIQYHVPELRPVRDVPDDYSRAQYYRHWTKQYLDMLDRLL